MTVHRPTSWRRAVSVSAAVAALALTLGGCASSASAGGRFDAGTATAPLSCLAHQSAHPGHAYTGAEGADTAAIFTMLRYYTSNKSITGYCDGKLPTKTDRSWAQLYVDLGAEPANVAHLRR